MRRASVRPRAKSCTICGIRTPDGASRCAKHRIGSSRLRACLVCGRPSQGNYCQLHTPELDEAVRNARNPYRRHYKDAQYAKNRKHRFERAHGRCESCTKVLQPGEWQCDHLVPVSKGGTNDTTNLRVLCVPCHKAKTAEDRRRAKG